MQLDTNELRTLPLGSLISKEPVREVPEGFPTTSVFANAFFTSADTLRNRDPYPQLVLQIYEVNIKEK